MSKMTAKYCMDEGTTQMKANSKEGFESAVGWFRKAYHIACGKGQMNKMVAANQKMGHARRKLVELGTSSEDITNTCVRSALRMALAMESGERHNVLSDEQTEELVDNMEYVSRNFFCKVKELEGNKLLNSINWFLYIVSNSKYIKNPAWNKIVLFVYLEHITLDQAQIRESLIKEDFRQVLSDLGGLAFSREEALRLCGDRSWREAERLDSIIKGLERSSQLANGLRYIYQAEETMKREDENTVDTACEALDLLSHAKLLTKEGDMNLFCKVKVYEGKLFLDLLLNKLEAKACFKAVLNVSMSHQWINKIWYQEAQDLLQKIEKAEIVVEDPDQRKTKHMKDLEPEINKLNATSNKTDIDFLNYIMDTFPPKHVGNFKKPEVTGTYAVMRKTFIKLAAYYHPDKVNSSIHGEKHKVLCEEITKRVNARYVKLKK